MDKNKRIITILSVFTIIFTLVGGTFAWWTWTSNITTGVAFTVEKEFSCSADGGQNINSTNIKLIPTSDCTNSDYALQREIKITPTINRDNLTISLDMWLTVNTLGTHLSESDNLMYAISTTAGSCKKDMAGYVTGGNFKGLTKNNKVNLLSGKEYTGKNLPADTYYLYIWLDAAETNNNTQNESFDFSLGGECTDDMRKTLSDTVIALSNVEGSGVYYEKVNEFVSDGSVVPAKKSEWASVDMSGVPISVSNESLGKWVMDCQCDYFGGECLPETSIGTMILKPKNEGYYNFTYDHWYYTTTSGNDIFVYVNDNEVTSYSVGEYDNGYPLTWKLGYLTANDEIKIVSDCYVPEASDTVFSFSYAPLSKVKDIESYRYEGKNVDNYITFNDETWRIIGVEEGSTIGLTSGEYYTKIIKNEKMSNFKYYNDLNTDPPDAISETWAASYGSDYLNYYYNSQKVMGYDWNGEEGVEADFETTGLTEESRNLIVNPSWVALNPTSVVSAFSVPTATIYAYEKTHDISSSSYVGLMSPSDYGYGALQSKCKNVSLTNYSSCVNDNWLYNGEEIVMSEVSYSMYALKLDETGNLMDDEVALNRKSYRPVVYLNSNVIITGGTGKSGDEYKIALAE